MPRRHRAAESSRVTFFPAKLTWPAPGARSPAMRPNRLVLPAPFGPTIPTVSPAPTQKLRSSAMTTRPNRFVTWLSSRSGVLIAQLSPGGTTPRTPRLRARWQKPPLYRARGWGWFGQLREGGQEVTSDLRVRLERVVDHDGLE